MEYSFVREQTGQKEKEFVEMEKALRTLSKEGLLTKIECRIIVRNNLDIRNKKSPSPVLHPTNDKIVASVRRLDARKIELYNTIISKYQQDPMSVLEILKILTPEIQEKADANTELSNFDADQEINVNPLSETGKNPLLNNTVIHNILKFLPLKEIKNCRLVNHQWNTIAEPFLRKKGVIHFKHETLKPLDFYYAEDEEFSLPDLAFTDFKFSSDSYKKWRPSELQLFFDTYGHNIKSLEFSDVLLNDDKTIVTCGYHDITSWIAKTKNLKKLIIRCSPDAFSKGLGIALAALTDIESLSLARCVILFSGEGNNRWMAPKEIYLEEVNFVKEGERYNPPFPKATSEWTKNFCFNDYIDFSHSLKIDVRCERLRRNEKKFDMSSFVLKANSIYLDGISVENWGGARGKIDSIFLSNVHLIERNSLEIKELTLKSGTVDISVVPHTIEKLRVSDNTEIICGYSLQLMSLKFLWLGEVSQSNLDVISRFACCANLVEVELAGCTLKPYLNLDMGNIPKSAKKLKIRNVKINTSGLLKRQLDTLIIEQSDFENLFEDVTELLSKKVLTLNVLVISYLNVTNNHATDIVRFVKSTMEKDKTIEKLVVGVVGNVCLNKNRKFEGSALSRYVDKESNHYQFTNEVGKSITAEEFEAFRNIGH